MASLARPQNTLSKLPAEPGGMATLPDDQIQSSAGRKFTIALFLILIIVPIQINFGTVRMSPYRFMLMAAFVPMVALWLSGKAGRVRPADWLLVGYGVWTIISLTLNHNGQRLEFSVIFFVETVGAYLLGRLAIRNLEDFTFFAKVLFWVLLLFIPFGWAEGVTRESTYISLFEGFGETIAPAGIDIRWGLNRAQVAFEHPILYGMFTASAFSVLFYSSLADRKRSAGFRRAWVSIVATFFSLSSGALSPIGVQMALMAFNGIFRSIAKRWKYFAIGAVVFYVLLDLASNRRPFEVIASALAFSNSTYYWRVLIFEFGMNNVWANPGFGLGLRNWARPHWMFTSTVDNFWLVVAMRFGIPAFFMFLGFYVLTAWGLIRANLPVKILSQQRYGAVFTMVAMALGISTVWLWNGVYVYFLFLLGSFSWMIDLGEKTQASAPATDTPGEETTAPKQSRWTRQTQSKGPAALPERRADAAPNRPSDAVVPARQKAKYSRVEPRAARNRRDQSDADKGH